MSGISEAQDCSRLIAARNTLYACYVDAARNGRPEQATNIGDQIDSLNEKIELSKLNFSRPEPRYLIQSADGLFVGRFTPGFDHKRLYVERSEAVQFTSLAWAESIRVDEFKKRNQPSPDTSKIVTVMIEHPGGICVRCAEFCETHELDEFNICDDCC